MWRAKTYMGVHGPSIAEYRCGACGEQRDSIDFLLCNTCRIKFGISHCYQLKHADAYNSATVKSYIAKEDGDVLYCGALDVSTAVYAKGTTNKKFPGTLAEAIKPKQDLPSNVFVRMHYATPEDKPTPETPKSELANLLFS